MKKMILMLIVLLIMNVPIQAGELLDSVVNTVKYPYSFTRNSDALVNCHS